MRACTVEAYIWMIAPKTLPSAVNSYIKNINGFSRWKRPYEVRLITRLSSLTRPSFPHYLLIWWMPENNITLQHLTEHGSKTRISFSMGFLFEYIQSVHTASYLYVSCVNKKSATTVSKQLFWKSLRRWDIQAPTLDAHLAKWLALAERKSFITALFCQWINISPETPLYET